jgi:hypothetical protein
MSKEIQIHLQCQHFLEDEFFADAMQISVIEVQLRLVGEYQ